MEYTLIQTITNLPIQIIILLITLLIGISSYVGYLLSSKEPDLNSGLNHSQKWGIITTTSFLIGISYLLYYTRPNEFITILWIFY